jgi:hypothetical protein
MWISDKCSIELIFIQQVRAASAPQMTASINTPWYKLIPLQELVTVIRVWRRNRWNNNHLRQITFRYSTKYPFLNFFTNLNILWVQSRHRKEKTEAVCHLRELGCTGTSSYSVRPLMNTSWAQTTFYWHINSAAGGKLKLSVNIMNKTAKEQKRNPSRQS